MAAPSTNIRLLLGGDSFQRDLALKEIKKRRYGDEETEILRFDASAGDVSSAIEEVVSYSLFNPNQIVVLERIEKTPKTDLSFLVEYASKPRGDTPFIFFAPSEKEISKPLVKAIGKTYIRTLPKTTQGEIRKIVQERCDEHNVSFANNAINFYMHSCGDNIDAALRELNKLILWAGEKGTISLELCRKLVQTEEEETIWAITNAVGDKDVQKALQSLDRLLEQGENEVDITRLLIGAFRSMYHCKTLMSEKTPSAELSQRTGKRGYGLTVTQKQTQGFTIDALRNSINRLRRADDEMKGGVYVPSPSHKRILIERLVIDLCQS